MLERLFAWDVTGWIVAGGIGVAFSFLALNDYKLAKVFFLIAAADAEAGTVMWGIKANMPSWQKDVITFVVGGAIAVLFVWTVRYVESKKYRVPATSPTATGKSVIQDDKSAGSEPKSQLPTTNPEVQRKDTSPVVVLRAYLQPNPSQPYADGTKIGGIDWSDKYVDVRLDIQNGPLPIQDFDVVFGLDTSIAAIGQISQFQGISTFPDSQPPPSWLEGQTADGNSQQIPITPTPGGAMIGPVYRIHCAEIYRSTTISLAIASVALNPVVGGKFPQQLFAPRRAPTQIAVKGTYRAGSKTYPIELKEKF